MTAAMRIREVVLSVGQSGYLHRDLMAIKAGARADGFIFHGAPVLPGYKSIVEAGTTISVMLVLEDEQVAFGDCADVILAGAAGRDRVFNAHEHLGLLEGEIRKRLTGLDTSMFRPNAEIDAAGFSAISQARQHVLKRQFVRDEVIGTEIATRFGKTVDDAPKLRIG